MNYFIDQTHRAAIKPATGYAPVQRQLW